MKRDELLAAYAAELKRVSGNENVSVKMSSHRVTVTTRNDCPGNRYTLKEIAVALEVLKKRPDFNASVPDFLTIP